MLTLNEDLFDNIQEPIEEVPEVKLEPIDANDLIQRGPQPGADTGIANIIHDLIIDENEAIQGYNNAIANLETRPELIPIMKDIVAEEMNHIGMLEVALEMISPNVDGIEEGEVEAEDILDSDEEDPGSPVDEALNESVAVFNTKLTQDQDKNGQEVIIKDRNDKSGQVLVEFPDGSEKWVYNTEIDESLNEKLNIKAYVQGANTPSDVEDKLDVLFKSNKLSRADFVDLMNQLSAYRQRDKWDELLKECGWNGTKDVQQNESLIEDTEKKSNGKWVNKGDEGEHGEFKTKKAADAQRKAMFANGYHESLDESAEDLENSELKSISSDYNQIYWDEIIDSLSEEQLKYIELTGAKLFGADNGYYLIQDGSEQFPCGSLSTVLTVLNNGIRMCKDEGSWI